MLKKQLQKKDIHILYVEDEDLIRREISSILQIIASKVSIAKNGQEGFEKFSDDIDLIITDVNMPILNGFEMLRKIRKQKDDIPAIILSAFSQPEFIKEANEIDIINDYLLKPIDVTTLFNKIEKNSKKIEKQKELLKVSRLLEQYKIAVDESAIISKANNKGLITYVNDKFCKISGFNRDELIGRSHNLVRHEDNTKEFFSNLWNKIKTKKQIWKGHIKNKAKAGHDYIVDVTIVPILDDKNDIEEFIAVRYDITELEAYKELLKEKLHSTKEDSLKNIHMLNQYENMINISASVLRIDLSKNITFANNRLLKLLGFEKEQILNKDFKSLVHEESQEEFEKLFKDILNEGSYNGVLKLVSKDKNVFYIEFTFRLIKDINGNITEYMGVGKDISETIELYEEIENTQKDVIFTLGTIGEIRSKETGNHVKRVAEYSYLFAHKFGLSKKECELIKMASPMHDIGKVGISDDILLKPGILTKEEFEIMKKHTQIGFDMLKNSNREILKTSAIIAYTHHEKYDGSGYPKGLKGDKINIFGRITAIADVFDALGSKRCYKEAWPLPDILKLIKEEKGKHFDPKLVDIFLENLDEFLEIRDKYTDEIF